MVRLARFGWDERGGAWDGSDDEPLLRRSLEPLPDEGDDADLLDEVDPDPRETCEYGRSVEERQAADPDSPPQRDLAGADWSSSGPGIGTGNRADRPRRRGTGPVEN